MSISLEIASKIIDAALAKGREMKMNPLTAAVVDDGVRHGAGLEARRFSSS